MAPRRYVPRDDVLRLMLENGMTHQQIADYVYESTGHRITRAAVTINARRLGFGNDRARYKDEIPWRVRMEHQKAYPVRMLRYLARDQRGMSLTLKEWKMLRSWLNTLEDAHLIVAYDPDDDQGFHYVDAMYRDHDDLSLPIRRRPIRLPKSA